MANRLDISDSTAVSMPMKNLLAIIAAVAVGVWAYFGVIERLNKLETNTTLLTKDLEQAEEALSLDIEKNNEFRIKWPRGDLGSPPADSEQFMLIEFLSGQVEAIQKELEGMMNNKVNIERLQKDMEKALNDIEELKDSLREPKTSFTEIIMMLYTSYHNTMFIVTDTSSEFVKYDGLGDCLKDKSTIEKLRDVELFVSSGAEIDADGNIISIKNKMPDQSGSLKLGGTAKSLREKKKETEIKVLTK